MSSRRRPRRRRLVRHHALVVLTGTAGCVVTFLLCHAFIPTAATLSEGLLVGVVTKFGEKLFD